ncbi:hypothetical protein GCM10025863_19480 [Microbacterium suwonense]|uniref:Uncharacterized protein n=1 Tax=Microbacterium suwonense TaxID=683047 RepID=A0ABN6X3M3_9MICO|nr:hypothetical protein GCM10025863_19480 [Microbacterium suwonense]
MLLVGDTGAAGPAVERVEAGIESAAESDDVAARDRFCDCAPFPFGSEGTTAWWPNAIERVTSVLMTALLPPR